MRHVYWHANRSVFECSGVRGRILQLVYSYLQSIPPTSVEAGRALSAAGTLCTKIRLRLSDATLDTCAFCAAIIASRLGLQPLLKHVS